MQHIVISLYVFISKYVWNEGLTFTEKAKKRTEVNIKNKIASYMRQGWMDRITDENVTVEDVERKLQSVIWCFLWMRMETSGHINGLLI